MQELVGKLIDLDSAASESVRVIEYFDALMQHGVGVHGLVRAAAALTGTVAGAQSARYRLRFEASGAVADKFSELSPVVEKATDSGSVWLEREGSAHPIDTMVIERLALAVGLVERRADGGQSAVEIAVDKTHSAAERKSAVSRLGLAESAQVKVLIQNVSKQRTSGRVGIVIADCGPVRVSIVSAAEEPGEFPAGVGTVVAPSELPSSFEMAVLAYRLTDAENPLIDATELGLLGVAVQVLEHSHAEHPDVLAVLKLDARTRRVLRALSNGASMRAAATEVSLHHSTVQAQHAALTRQLGYDPRKGTGSSRFLLADLLARLQS